MPQPLKSNRLAITRRNYELLKKNPRHLSLHFKKSAGTVRVGLRYRALGVEIPEVEYLQYLLRQAFEAPCSIVENVIRANLYQPSKAVTLEHGRVIRFSQPRTVNIS